MHYPSRQEFLAACHRGNLVPVFREILADGDTPVSAHAKLGRRDYGFLLESVVGGQNWAAYSFIGAAPRAVLTVADGRARLSWRDPETGAETRVESFAAPDPAAALANVLARRRPVEVPGLPRFWGGAVGWLGYDAVRAFERLPATTAPGLPLPELCAVLTDTVVIFDNLRQTVKVVTAVEVPGADPPDGASDDANDGVNDGASDEARAAAYEKACARVDAVIAKLAGPAPGLRQELRPIAPPPIAAHGAERDAGGLRWGGGAEPRSAFAREAFEAAVARIREYILAGDIFQAVLSQRLEVPLGELDPFDVYRALRVVNPSPYMFHLEFPEARVTGASPETLVRLSDGVVEVRPIAGTRPRGDGAARDEQLARELFADPKERAEHLMLVDLGRNDVGRVARTGSVEVTELMAIERYSHVMHMTSHVRGALRKRLAWPDVLRAAFPAGTLSGAPKIRAMEIIEELEPHRRGIYGGAVGYVSWGGNLDMAIAIRTLVEHAGTIYLQAGAGIVHDSDPAAEYEETLNKARGLLRAIAIARAPSEEAGGDGNDGDHAGEGARQGGGD